jgi:NADP-dependent 3-hydroxy acid dehydrogenase YdfG
MENNNVQEHFQYKEVEFDENITLFSFDVKDRESIERLIERLRELQDEINEYSLEINNL